MREELCAQQDSNLTGSLSAVPLGRQHRPDEPGADNYISPMQFPAMKWNKPNRASHRVTKRHRKLLKTSAAIRSLRVNSTSSSEPTPRSWQHFYHTQKTRHRLIKEVCAKYRSNISRTITPHHVSRIYVEDRHKLLYCEVPKAGCSNWKRVLMVLAGVASSTDKINHDTVHYGNHLPRLDSFDQHAVSERLRSYTKVLFIREPMERLVSAFRDKFESPNSYYHPVFGKPIISKYRVNASKSALRTGSGVTFQEFIRYLLDVHRPIGMDIHWEPVSQLCSPCLLDYDFIGKFETIEEEANFLLDRVGAPKNLTFPTFKDRNPEAARTSTHITQRYFTQLSASDRQRVYDFYYMDYLMFNYSKPFQDVY
ncbi:carbohydrate sulfotransferase 8 [Ictalurus punctatus]|uniref:Carbohydrate sulfotransferase n=1 Tax=Ictalurus punctatus TaxID=7998 RepID=A0A979ETP1_ICTPU|nr:carbohydrate sulfotransferase 8 [Ictalurus punctatus]XP_053534122.1 carbohydrate sulfotransferase 8 [Ictalurus punctatus]XP_053534123.1 carbohydrate sulfotransferase 8 [Ictalurus punctatus]